MAFKIKSDGQSPRDYYWKLFDAKKNNKEWAKNINLDISSFNSIHGKCLYCGNPNMDDAMNGAECKRCGIKRLIEIYGYSKENAEKEYEHLQKRKEKSLKFYEMLDKKRISNNIRNDQPKIPEGI